MSDAPPLLNATGVREFVARRLETAAEAGDTAGVMRLALLNAIDKSELVQAVDAAIRSMESGGEVVVTRRHPAGNRYALARYGTAAPVRPKRAKEAPAQEPEHRRPIPRQGSHCKGDLTKVDGFAPLPWP